MESLGSTGKMNVVMKTTFSMKSNSRILCHFFIVLGNLKYDFVSIIDTITHCYCKIHRFVWYQEVVDWAPSDFSNPCRLVVFLSFYLMDGLYHLMKLLTGIKQRFGQMNDFCFRFIFYSAFLAGFHLRKHAS